jgi:FtsZ-binding cell division protein ZapB
MRYVEFHEKGFWCIVELVKFKELEDKIKSLIEDYSLLKERNQKLEELLTIKEGELEEAGGQIRKLNEEKDAIRAKVDSLLGIMQNVHVPK